MWRTTAFFPSPLSNHQWMKKRAPFFYHEGIQMPLKEEKYVRPIEQFQELHEIQDTKIGNISALRQCIVYLRKYTYSMLSAIRDISEIK